MVAIATYNLATIGVDLITDNWIAANVANTTPLIDKVWNHKRLDLRSTDAILIYESGSLNTSRGDLEWASRDIDGTFNIDIRSMISEDRLDLLYNEIDRILLANRGKDGVEPATGWHKLELVNRVCLTNKAIKLYRYVLSVKIVARKKII